MSATEETTSEEELVSEYQRLCGEKSKVKEFYLFVLIELEKAVSKGDFERFNSLSIVIDYLTDLEDQVTLRDCYKNEGNPIKRTNLVILATKHNKVKILEYLFEGRSKVLESLSVGIGEDAVSPKDEDEAGHNAFYYAIRSENIRLLDTLIDKWPNNCLDEFLSRAYGELKLKNVPMSFESEMNVEKKLVDLRFFSNNSGEVESFTNKLDNIRERIELLLESIGLLQRDYSGTEKVDGRFLFLAKSIAQNINILKGQIKSTYNKLPWEELEFCLVVFVYSQAKTKPQALNLFYRCKLSKCKILDYLGHFAQRLQEESGKLANDKFHCFPTKEVVQKKTNNTIEVVKIREEVLADVIANHQPFDRLIDDFQQIRDIHSLQKIGDHIKWALATDAREPEGKLIITRSLQVMGEHLKYTLESPKLSPDTAEILVSLLPKNTKAIITKLRDSISHADSLALRLEVERKTKTDFFIDIQNEIKTVGGVITDYLYENKVKTIRMLLEKINLSENLDDIKEILEDLEQLDAYESITVNFKRSEHENLEELVEAFRDNIPDQTDDEQDLFKKIDSVIDCGGTQSKSVITDYLIGYSSLRTLSFALDDSCIAQIKREALEILRTITPKVKPHRLIDIGKLAVQIFFSARTRMPEDKRREVERILTKICVVPGFESYCINSISKFHEELEKEDPTSSGSNDPNSNKIETALQLTSELLKGILDKNPLVNYKSDKKLQSAVEMLVLDIMSISESYLENNQLCLDDYSPLLIGKCLRNHLAHDNALVDVLLTDCSRSVILNAKKLAEGNIMASGKKIGKILNDDPIKLRKKYHRDLVTIANQEEMFGALQEGTMENLEHCLRNGADIKARSINLWTTLHFAAVGSSLEIVKFIVHQGIGVNAEDDHGQTPLHIAAAHGRQNIVDYFVTEAGAHIDHPSDRGKTPLHVAVQNGHKETVEVLLNNGANAVVQDTSGLSPLRYALSNRHVDIAKILLQREISVDINETLNGTTRLFDAARSGQLELVNFLLENGADVNAGNDKSGEVALHVAAFEGHPDVVDVLIERGASVDAENKINNRGPLHFAALRGNVDIINILVDRGADVNAADKAGATPLHYAANKVGYDDIVATLLDKGADPDLANDAGMTPLHFAANYNHLKIVAMLCKRGVNVNAKCKAESTPLHYAANCGHAGVVALLLEKGADVDARNTTNTALHVAALKGHRDVADVLIRNNAEVNVRNTAGSTPLHLATKCGNKDIVELLVETAEVNVLCNDGYAPLHSAVLENHEDIMSLLVKRGAKFDIGNCAFPAMLMSAIYAGSKEIVECLLKNGAESIVKTNANPLIYAIGLNNKEIVEVLVANGANISVYGGEALLVAIRHGYSDIVDILLRKKVNVDKEDSQSVSPLHLAVEMGNKRVVSALIAKKVKVDVKDNNNVTALALAAYHGNEEIVKQLIERGKAKVNDETAIGATPLHMAALKGHRNVVKILLDKKANADGNDAKNRTPMELAASHGHLQVVELLLESGNTDLNSKGHNDFTLLHYASLGNNLELIEYLVDKGCNVHAEDSVGYKPMHGAAEEGYRDIVDFFLSKGISINDPVQDKSTMLHMAATNGHLEFVNYLIAKGADLNPEDINGMTPISYAAFCRHGDIVEVLLGAGVNISTPGPSRSQEQGCIS